MKSFGREYLPGSTSNKWNKLSELDGRQGESVFTEKVVEFEKQAIVIIKQRISASAEEEQIV